MARDVIDELSLKIDIDVDKGASKTISSLARAITKLNTAVASVGNLQKYVRSLNSLNPKSINVRGTTGVGKVGGKTITPKYKEVDENKTTKSVIPPISISELKTYDEWKDKAELLTSTVKVTSKGVQKLYETFKYVNQEGKIFTATAIDKKLTQISNTGKVAKQEVEELNEELEATDKPLKKSTSTFKKLIKSIGRIAFYRAIRMALNQIVKGAIDGLTNIRQLDSGLDKALKNLSLSSKSLNNSIASLIAPFIKTIEPLITRLADGLARISNRIAEAKAAISGASTYQKILTSDTEEWRKQVEKATGALLSFDKFEALNKKDNSYIGAIEAPVEMSKEEASSTLSLLKDIEAAIWGIVGAIGALSIASFIKSLSILNLGLGGTLTVVGGLLGIFVGIYEIVKGVKDIMNWDSETSGLQKLADVLRVIFGVVAAIAGVLAIVKAGTIAGGVAAALAVVAVLGSITAGVASQKEKLKAYANGGTYQKGEHFIAGEAGTEVVYSSNSGAGAGGVANIEQISQAQYIATMNAIQDSGILDAINNVGGDVVMDGRKVGQIVTKTVHDEGVRVGYFKRA